MGNKKISIFVSLFVIASICIVILLFFEFNEEKKKLIFVYGFNGSIKKRINVSYPPTNISKNCTKDSDCVWMITNCCPVDEGANWECINRNSYIDCKSKMYLCPQVSSPKPNIPCKCINGECHAA